jgi:hypothetical protein
VDLQGRRSPITEPPANSKRGVYGTGAVLSAMVSIAVTTVLVGCRDATAPTPDVPPSPAAIAPRPPQLPPLPPEERTTRVLPLDSKTCGASDTTYIDHTIAEVLARCVTTARTTRVMLTVLSRATDPADHLQGMSQRFCGNVIDATGPEGWKVSVERERGLRDLAGQVTWESPALRMPHSSTRDLNKPEQVGEPAA